MQREKKEKKEAIDGSGLKIAIVVSLFNEDITKKMLSGALKCLKENNVGEKNIGVFYAPGSFELPLICEKLIKTGKYNGIIAVGCVIKGDTDHYYYIAGEASRAIMDLTLKYGMPIGFGIITTNNLKQAVDRSGENNNKGYEAAEAVLLSIQTIQSIK